MGQHTPGHWISIKGIDDDTERWGVYVNGPMQYHVATIENGAPGDTLETEGANARLIAAAPELLEVLKSRHPFEICEQPECDACAVIAKAEGKEPHVRS